MRRSLVIALAATLLFAACSTTEGAPRGDVWDRYAPDEPVPTGVRGGAGGVGLAGIGFNAGAAALQQFDACDSFLQWVRSAAAEKVGPYGLDPHGGMIWVGRGVDDGAVEEMMPPADDAGGDAGVATASQVTEDFSATNVQEAGVDEPDLVKTDGSRLYVVSRGFLYSIDATTSTPALIDRIRLTDDAYGVADLLLGDDRIYAISTSWGPTEFATDDALTDAIPDTWMGGASVVVVTEIAVAPGGGLSEGATMRIDGSYVSAPQIGSGVRLVVRHDVGNRLGFLFPSRPEGEEEAIEHNRREILESGIDDWIAGYRIVNADGGDVEEGLLTDCTRMTAPQEFSGSSSVSLLSLDLTRPLDRGNAATLFGAAETVYASTTSLYAATYAYPDVMPLAADGGFASDPVADFTTQIHHFDITDPGGASYVASGEVPGRLLSQWALSEHEGHLRVATTEGSPWWGPGGDAASSSSVVVLRTEGRDLVPTGIVEGLGPDEDIVGVRFIGDLGYVVTFRRTDPLYVLDLTDPAAPSVEGELKITGYSAYLHPVGEGLLLGVGQEATEDGMTIGTKVSLFDVSDPADPREVDRWVLGDSSSAVEWDHRAFLYWPSDRLAVVPLDWAADDTGAVGIRVGDGTLAEAARIVQQPPAEQGMNPACRRLEAGDLPENVGRDLVESGSVVVECPDDEPPWHGSAWCEDAQSYYGFDPADAAPPAAGGDVSVCWPDEGWWSERVRRGVVIGDVLWTVGERTVQANDLGTLSMVGHLDL